MMRRQSEHDRLRAQREEQIRQELEARELEREILRKRKFFLIEDQKRREREALEAEARRREGIHAQNTISSYACLPIPQFCEYVRAHCLCMFYI